MLGLLQIEHCIFILLLFCRDTSAQNEIFRAVLLRQIDDRPNLALSGLNMLLLELVTRHEQVVSHAVLC